MTFKEGISVNGGASVTAQVGEKTSELMLLLMLLMLLVLLALLFLLETVPLGFSRGVLCVVALFLML